MKLSYLNKLINELKRIGYPTSNLSLIPADLTAPHLFDFNLVTPSHKVIVSQGDGKIYLDAVLERIPLKTLKLIGIDVNLYCASSLKLFDKVPSRAEAVVARHIKS